MDTTEKADTLTVRDVARIRKVKESTVRGWIRAGWLRATRVGRGPFRVRRLDLEQAVRLAR